MRRHWAVAALLAVVGPLLLAFGWQEALASLGDDSASYLAQAQALARANPAILPWVGYHTHFPPLFPAALALTGGATDWRMAHALVALFGAAAVGLAYRFAWLETGRRDASLLVAVVFAACPTAWISAKGILSEPMFLCATLLALAHYRARIEPRGGAMRDWLVLGLLLAAVVLTRLVGLALVLGLLAHLAVRARRRENGPGAAQLAAALLPLALLAGAWIALRPVAAQDSYQRVSTAMARSWASATGLMGDVSLRSLADGWIASFTADAAVGPAAAGAVLALALAALAGLVRRLAANRLDAWYAAVGLAVVFGWVFSEDNTRRLLYPLLPLLLLYAGETVTWACERAGRAVLATRAVAVAAAVPAIACLPAMAVLAQKAFDREPVVAGHAPRLADITEYYTTLNLARSRALAAKHAVVLAGFEALRRGTPPESRVMWMRPEYPALLAAREGVAWYYDWDPARLARAVRDERVDYIVVAQLFKTDLAGRSGDPSAPLRDVSAYARPVLSLANPVSGATEFVLMQVDRAALGRAFRPGA